MSSAAPHETKAKPKIWLIVLIVLGVIVGGIALLIGGAVWWVSSNKERFLAVGREANAAATTFAATHDQNACVNEGLRMTKACGGVLCEAKAKVFVEKCIRKASTTMNFCRGVPERSEIIATVTWVQSECARRGFPSDSDQRCARLIQAVPEACHAPISE